MRNIQCINRPSACAFLALVAALAATTVLGSPAVAASTIACATDAPATPVSAPAPLAAAPVLQPDGTPTTTYAGIALPQAVLQDPRTGRTLVAYVRGDRALVIADIDTAATGSPTIAETVLTDAAGAPARFSQGSATSTTSGGNLNDSHNNLTIGIDRAGYIHVAGNTHDSPFTYWRSTAPDSIAGMQNAYAAGPMAGVWIVKNAQGAEIRRYLASGSELGATSYPDFFTGPDGALFLSWRSGDAGRGNQFLYTYDETTSRWSSVSGASMQYAPYPDGYPLLEGISAGVGPYVTRPVRGPDGFYWMAWVWRDDPANADSNGRISAAKSRDLSHWYSLNGTALPSTIPFGDTRVIVDDVPLSGGGVLNGQVTVGFDGNRRPVITYFKYSGSGANKTTQLFAARPSGLQSVWIVDKISSWSGIYDLSLPGIDPQVKILGGAQPAGTGDYRVRYSCTGSPTAREITATMRTYNGTSKALSDLPVGTTDVPTAATTRATSTSRFPNLAARTAASPAFDRDGTSVRWLLCWDAGPYIVNGLAPAVAYPSTGSPLALILAPADGQ
jgi:hypothetical protein